MTTRADRSCHADSLEPTPPPPGRQREQDERRDGGGADACG